MSNATGLDAAAIRAQSDRVWTGEATVVEQEQFVCHDVPALCHAVDALRSENARLQNKLDEAVSLVNVKWDTQTENRSEWHGIGWSAGYLTAVRDAQNMAEVTEPDMVQVAIGTLKELSGLHKDHPSELTAALDAANRRIGELHDEATALADKTRQWEALAEKRGLRIGELEAAILASPSINFCDCTPNSGCGHATLRQFVELNTADSTVRAVPLCDDCKHVEIKFKGKDHEIYNCRNPKVGANDGLCEFARREIGSCGIDGKLFEAAP